jgi:hypothetical protein
MPCLPWYLSISRRAVGPGAGISYTTCSNQADDDTFNSVYEIKQQQCEAPGVLYGGVPKFHTPPVAMEHSMYRSSSVRPTHRRT